MAFELTEREHRWLTVLLILGTVAVAFIVLGFVAGMLLYFGDVIMVFFLAWLLAFVIGPIANALVRVTRLPHALAVILVYAGLIAIFVVAVLLVAQQLYTSISQLVGNWSQIQTQMPQLLAPWQERLNAIGLGQVDLAAQASTLLDSLQKGATDLVNPLRDLAFASIGIMGNLLFVFFLSIYMAVDRERIVSFLFRLVPPAYSEEAALLETSVSRSFGGFLRGQALMGVIYGLVAAFASTLLGLPYMPVTSTAAGILQAIPFFGPFISWAPPVIVAIFFAPQAIVPTLIIMFVGWFVVMNVIQPRLMADAVGLHPIVVLGSVLIGSKLAGVPGAIFGLPIAAVISAFFFYYLGQRRIGGPVAERAAQRVQEREGRPIRIPREPQPGEDAEVESGTLPLSRQQARRRLRLPTRPGITPPETPAAGDGTAASAPAMRAESDAGPERA